MGVIPVADSGILVPVERTGTLRATVTHAVEAAISEGPPEIHFVYVASWRGEDPGAERRLNQAQELLDDAVRWAEYDQEEAGVDGDVTIQTAIVGTDEYLFGAEQYAEQLVAYAEEQGIDEIVLDPEYSPVGTRALLRPLEYELARSSIDIREAPVDRPSRRAQLVSEINFVRFASIFSVSFVFYLILGDPTYAFDLVTGVASATMTAIALSRISLSSDPTFPGSFIRIGRLAIYVPVLLLEIVKANVMVAGVILRPSMPIEPRMTRVRSLVGSGLPITTLANSITLTPGTLTVRARNENLYVHALIPWAREGLFAGSLERWTRFIFYGRGAARLPTPEERGDCSILQGPEADEPLPDPTRASRTPATDGGQSDIGSTAEEVAEDSTADETDANDVDSEGAADGGAR
ncbi:MAG: monovalent cation/H+ antiporter subunit E [Halopenitus sp.]